MIKTEIWNGHKIRFVEKSGEWWAVAVDVTKALSLSNTTKAILRVDDQDKALILIQGINRGNEPVNIVSEYGIYDMVMGSRKKEAKEFKRWVFDVIKQLRISTGLEGFQIFRMLDKGHQREAMGRLRAHLAAPVRVDFIKANTIANKAVSTMYGHEKMVKKDQMTPDMLIARQQVLDDTVDLMSVVDRLKIPLKVSETIYNKYVQ